MPTIRVLPAELCFESNAGESVFEAARRAGMYWPTSCGGHALCGLCVMRVVEGSEALPARKQDEMDRIASLRSRASYWVDGEMRLACCTVPFADVIVEQPLARRNSDAVPSASMPTSSRTPRGLPGWDRFERPRAKTGPPATAAPPPRKP